MTFTSLVKFILGILFSLRLLWIGVYLYSVSLMLLVCRKAIDFCRSVLYLDSLLNLLVISISFWVEVWESLVFSANKDSFISYFSISPSPIDFFFYFALLIELLSRAQCWKELGKADISVSTLASDGLLQVLLHLGWCWLWFSHLKCWFGWCRCLLAPCSLGLVMRPFWICQRIFLHQLRWSRDFVAVIVADFEPHYVI